MATITPTITLGPTLTFTSATSSVTCTTAVPGKYGYVSPDACNSRYLFEPSFPGNLAFAVLFGLSTIIHLIEAIAFKKGFCWVIIMGGAWETAAFALRTLGAHDQQQLAYAILGQVLFLLAPLWINAFVYMAVARMIYMGLPDKKIWGIRAIKLTLLFVWLDIACFLVQLSGGALLSNNDNPDLSRIGMKLYTAGIGVQLGFIIIFGSMTVWFYRKYYLVTGGHTGRMKFLIWALLTVLVLIVMRIIYRLVEFGQGVDSNNPILSHEAYPFGLDASPMVLALTIMNLMHPGLVLRGPDSEFPKVSRAEKKAIKAAKKEEKKQRKAAKKARKTDQGGGYVVTEDIDLETRTGLMRLGSDEESLRPMTHNRQFSYNA
ncbi:putative lipid transporter atnI [Cladobotryum mycophilum]|uniref:Lipid transporter atnI n=1 Tax=Cladobotryum mycophilum TaxID=491253 RepID=A0ABR0S736_9HYPO